MQQTAYLATARKKCSYLKLQQNISIYKKVKKTVVVLKHTKYLIFK
jgi:hypothetical protein